MFENESQEIEVEQPSDVQEDSSSESQVESQPEQQAAKPEAKEVPFHEHPRWIERQNELVAERQARQALESRVAEMQRALQESSKPKPQDPMYERLKGIDPEFADYMQGLKTRAEKAEALEARLEQFERQQFTNSAKSTFNELNTKNNVPAELASLYEQQLEAAYARGEFKDIDGLKQAYDKIHDNFNKLLSAREKQAIEKYTTAKKQDASKPGAQPKGQPAGVNKGKISSDPYEARQQLVQAAVKQLRAEREL
jgi:hypothetical protein